MPGDCRRLSGKTTESGGGAGQLGAAAGHQEAGGLQNELDVHPLIRGGLLIVHVELGDGAGHVLPELLAPQGALLQVGLQIGPQVRLILVMLQERIGVVLVVGEGCGETGYLRNAG